MTAIGPSEYRKLELDSSNDIIRHDARRSDRKYAEAAWHALQAGHGRRLMGILMRDAGQFTRAAEDWLSASACFYLATAPHLLRSGLEKVRELDRAGHIPRERRDMHAAMQERDTQLNSLELRLTAFIEEYARLFGSALAARQAKLEFLRKHVRELPGFARLHFAIYQQASALGAASLAAEHLRWAAQFAPDEPEYVGRYGYQLITAGQPERAADIARWFLTKHPQEPSIRVMLAQALASPAAGARADLNTALEILREVLNDENVDVKVRLAAITLSGVIRRGLGEEAEAAPLLVLFDRLSPALGATDQTRIAALRQMFTKPVPDTNGLKLERHDPYLAEPIQAELFQNDGELALAR
jgi:hypothetical protein